MDAFLDADTLSSQRLLARGRRLRREEIRLMHGLRGLPIYQQDALLGHASEVVLDHAKKARVYPDIS